jgi:hypothetical protein
MRIYFDKVSDRYKRPMDNNNQHRKKQISKIDKKIILNTKLHI